MQPFSTFLLALLLTLALTPFLLPLAAAADDLTPPAYADPAYHLRYLTEPIEVTPGRTFHVSPGRTSAGSGTKDDPFATPELARDAIRALKETQGLPEGGVQVLLAEGTYHFEKPFVLTEADSGTAAAPVVYRGVSARATRISGGTAVDVTAMAVVQAAGDLARLPARARGRVMSVAVADPLRPLFGARGDYGMIAMDGHLLTLAQWPNRGYHHVDQVIDPGPTTRWLKPGERPAAYHRDAPTGGRFTTRETISPLVHQEFERSGDMRAQGYFHNDWFFQDEPVGGIAGGVVQLLRYTRYGLSDKIKSIPRRVRLVNVLAELDEPGEWYFDQARGRLYVWPIGGFNPATSRVVALGTQNPPAPGPGESAGARPRPPARQALFTLNQTAYVTLSHLTFEDTGHEAVAIRGGTRNLVAASVFRNGLNRGASIRGGVRNGITASEFHNLENAFVISGGDFKTLTRCYNFATNNRIHAMRRRGYHMISLQGVGLYFAHNLLHDMNGAVTHRSVDSLIEYNEFYNVGYEMGDFNVVYCGAVWHTMNNVVRFNLVHHLMEPGGHPVMAFRNDDNGMGLKIYGNVFYRSGRGAAQGDGALNVTRNNITLHTNVMWWTLKKDFSPAGVARSWKSLERFGRDLPRGDKGDTIYILEQLLGERGWEKSPWIDQFPELKQVIDTNPFAQTMSEVRFNYVHDVRRPFHIHGGDGTVEGMESDKVGGFKDLPPTGVFELPKTISPDAFVDVKSLNFNFKSSFEPMPGFTPIPFDDIGLVQSTFRPSPPDKNTYRRRVYDRFKDQVGGRYDADLVNARYPKRSYE